LKAFVVSVCYVKQIFTNGENVQVLNRLGFQDCFEGIICFETLNPPSQITENNNDWNIPTVNSTIAKTPVICKPSKEAIKQALSLAKANPQRTVWN
jgi:pyrimidine and pyridine-specific 5'-nucleotidase